MNQEDSEYSEPTREQQARINELMPKITEYAKLVIESNSQDFDRRALATELLWEAKSELLAATGLTDKQFNSLVARIIYDIEEEERVRRAEEDRVRQAQAACLREKEKELEEKSKMSCSNCYFCKISHAPRTHPLGNINEPLGTCENCSSFACGHHGDRDRTRAKYRCVMCVAALLTSSATFIYTLSINNPNIEPPDADRDEIVKMLALYDRIEFSFFESIEDFFQRHPDLAEQLRPKLRNYRADWQQIERNELKFTILQFPPESRELLKAAGILVRESEAGNHYAPILQEIAAVVRAQG